MVCPKNYLKIEIIEKVYNETCSHKMRDSRKISFERCKQIHDVQTLSFKMIYNMPGLLPYLGSKTHYFLQKFLVFNWFLKCSMSHISFSSLATRRLFCENRSHMFKSQILKCSSIRGYQNVALGNTATFTPGKINSSAGFKTSCVQISNNCE